MKVYASHSKTFENMFYKALSFQETKTGCCQKSRPEFITNSTANSADHFVCRYTGKKYCPFLKYHRRDVAFHAEKRVTLMAPTKLLSNQLLRCTLF